jgi:tetratricopeptide (TPR) repeat protein
MSNIRQLLEAAQQHHKAGRLTDAEREYNIILMHDPKNTNALRLLGGLYAQSGKYEQAMLVYERALRIVPINAEIHNNMGKILELQGQPQKAVTHYEQSLRSNPKFFDPALNLGNILLSLGKPADAEKILRTAMQQHANNTEILMSLGNALRFQNKISEAESTFDDVLVINPHHVGAITNLAALRNEQGKIEEGLALSNRALSIDPAYREALWNKALSLLTLGEMREGWALYESGLDHPHLRGAQLSPVLRWDGRLMPNKTLLICSEQGFGDSLQFIRYAKLCKQKVGRIHVVCPPPLVNLFSRLSYVDMVSGSLPQDGFDAHVSMMSLPYLFGTELSNIPNKVPYLSAPPELDAKWRVTLCGLSGLRVGLVWAGNAAKDHVNANAVDCRRSLHLKQLLPLMDVPNVSFVSLQMGPSASEIVELGLTEQIIDFMGEVTDFADTAAIIHHLDLVISVDTSVAHLAGAMGKPIWILSRYDACWRWLRNREDSPWYPSARIFGQPSPDDWNSVIEKVRSNLNDSQILNLLSAKKPVSMLQKLSETIKRFAEHRRGKFMARR